MWFPLLVLTTIQLAAAIVCPGGRTTCAASMTCCELPHGGEGCCPYANATCCADKVHCCPQGYFCKNGRCKKEQMYWYHIPGERIMEYSEESNSLLGSSGESNAIEQVNINNKVTNTTLSVGTRCPDGSSCKGHETCCLISPNAYGCCPDDYGVCCNDYKRCCPQGYKCSGDVCTKTIENPLPVYTPPLARTHVSPSLLLETSNFDSSIVNVGTRCPDGSSCIGHETCCLISPKTYGCCPDDYGVCCNDYKHCCPRGYKCSGSGDTCIKATENSVPMYTPPLAEPDVSPSLLLELSYLNSSTMNVGTRCPDGSSCIGHETCCLTSPKTYGCCPDDYGVCCNDYKHCCPQGYKCSSGGELCTKATENSVPMYTAPLAEHHVSPSLLLEISYLYSSTVNVGTRCPDGSSCIGHETCCLISPKTYGCCPDDYGVCCNDYKHCCPRGYKCSGGGDTCIKVGDIPFPVRNSALTNTDVSPKKLLEISSSNSSTMAVGTRCPDGSSCTGHETCCLTSPNTYGCCPNDYGVCCNDYKHCCPQGYKCADDYCIKASDDPVFIHTESSAKPRVSPRKLLKINYPNTSTVAVGIHCPDGSSCRDKQTCCHTGPKSYGCCPAEHAVCCDDYKSCCPQGYKCDGSFCVKATDPAPMHTPSLTQAHFSSRQIVEINDSHSGTVVADIHCPDGSSCRDKQTCCHTSPKSYGCCPAEHAVCCDDFSSCCPQGYKCAGSFCIKNDDYGEVFLSKLQVIEHTAPEA
ncbi:progranulin-like [Periplaneta americana]|uniref:progranulin-like n=1 Tax=Periplaneta americana TaxID=6978 RepID=UPI0037E8316F